jgi:hypothetical protein
MKKLWNRLKVKVNKLLFTFWKKVNKKWYGLPLIWLNNVWMLFLTDRSEIRVFTGWGHYWFAKRYADKRCRLTKVNKVAGGKRHFVLPAGTESLIVVNRMEIMSLKDRRIIDKKVNIDYLLKNAYYITN